MARTLSSEERRLWLDVIDALPASLLSRAGEAVLERFAANWARWRAVQKTIAKTGLLVQSPQGPIRNPLPVVQGKAAKEMHADGEVIGLRPSRAPGWQAPTGTATQIQWRSCSAWTTTRTALGPLYRKGDNDDGRPDVDR